MTPTLEGVLAAVRRHKSNIWGNGPVEHDEDVTLYAACGIKGHEKCCHTVSDSTCSCCAQATEEHDRTCISLASKTGCDCGASRIGASKLGMNNVEEALALLKTAKALEPMLRLRIAEHDKFNGQTMGDHAKAYPKGVFADYMARRDALLARTEAGEKEAKPNG